MKKILSLILAGVLTLSLGLPALAYGDVTWSEDTTLTAFINRYDNATVGAGVTLTMKEYAPDPQGLEIYKSLTVEAGGRITGGGCIIFSREASCTGFDLYYRVAGEEKRLAVPLAEVVAAEPNHSDYRPTFLYDKTTGHYVLVADYANDPFEQPQPADGGSGQGVDARLTETAEKLKALGLFLGSDLGFELERRPTRIEEVIMLIRLLGKEREAANGSWTHPFTDVPDWADPYVGYAYEKRLTSGISADRFGVDGATVQQFETFVLRAMGYSDANGADFTWDHPETLARNLGIVLGPDDETNFNRGTCVKIMEIALRNAGKDGTRLCEKLAGEGVFSLADYTRLFDAGN
jgi:hypothetical protein